MKSLVASFLLCFCLITQSTAGNRYNNNDWRSMPFIEMMATMMRIMNNIMGVGDGNSYYGLNTLPYSPAFAPGSPFSMYNGLTGFNNLPMSPTNMSGLPMNNMTTSLNPMLSDSFQTGQNAGQSSNQFWNINEKNQAIANNSLNGIWQAFSGDVIAIYNNDRFIWSDGNARNLAGRLVIKGNILYAYIPASKVTLQFQFYKESGQFVVRDKSSRIYTFKRLH